MSLNIKNLNKNYGRKAIFSNYSYEFKETGIYLLKGDSGRGKTTLLRMIAGLDKNFSGVITGGGIPNVSFAFQEYRLFPNLTAVENVMTASKGESDEDIAKARELLKRLGFTEDDMHLYPSELSGGMRQRTSLARAFLKKSPILLLDEPTKELDPVLCDVVADMILEAAKSQLVIVVSHTETDLVRLGATPILL